MRIELPLHEENDRVGSFTRPPGIPHHQTRGPALQRRKAVTGPSVSRDDKIDRGVTEIAETIEQHERHLNIVPSYGSLVVTRRTGGRQLFCST